jgi:CheY-like chemotaxis protein
MTIENPIVLLVDDLDDAAELMRIVFQRSGYTEPLRTVNDGERAIDYLRGTGDSGTYKQLGMPTIVLLDLNMPRKNGFEVLTWIRQQPALDQLCVCILSASSLPEDIARAYSLGANAYFVKPGNLAGLLHLATSLLAWLRLVQFAPSTIDEPSPVTAPADGAHVEVAGLRWAGKRQTMASIGGTA